MEVASKILARSRSNGETIDVRDLFIGSIALSNGYKLLTNNKEHFRRIEGLELYEE